MAKFEKALTALLDSFKEEYRVPGYDCSVWQHGREIYRRMAGFANLENGAPITGDTLYNIYSNTKVIACTAALQLFEQGLFLLEDNLSRFFPEFGHMKVRQMDGTLKDTERPITIRDLFRMTAGFGDGSEYEDIGMKFYRETGGACPIFFHTDSTRLHNCLRNIIYAGIQ